MEDLLYRIYRRICRWLGIRKEKRFRSKHPGKPELPIKIDHERELEIDQKAIDHWVCRKRG